MTRLSSSAIGPDLRAALVAMVRKRVPESEVEDVVQSTLADAIASPHAPTDDESLRRWIFGVAKNKVVDYHRRAARETFDVPEIAGKSAPHTEADLLRWAENNLPPGEENKTTLDWMLREGEGEKLESIAEAEKVPAPRVRQRVSRLRRHLKTHWQKEVALLASVGVLITILVLVLRDKEHEPIANEDAARAEELRKHAFDKCRAAAWKDCLDGFDAAKRLDPAGDTRPEVRLARDNANKALTLPPAPLPTPTAAPTTDNSTPAPLPTPSSMPSSFPSEPWGKTMKEPGPHNRKENVAPMSTEMPKKMTPAPVQKPSPAKGATSKFDKGGSSLDGWGSSSPPAEAKPSEAKKKGGVSSL